MLKNKIRFFTSKAGIENFTALAPTAACVYKKYINCKQRLQVVTS